jgi:hypothetical protein
MNAMPAAPSFDDEAAILADLDPDGVALLEREMQVQLASVVAAMQRRSSHRQFEDLFPDTDVIQADGSTLYARDRYPKHIEFFNASATYRETCFLAANRVGKTICGAYATTAHLTGLYPHWWKGKRFDGPVSWWACGRKNETTRDIVQQALLGEVTYDTEDGRKGFSGRGMIPSRLMGRITWKRGVDDLVDSIRVKHVTGGWSRLV